MIHPVSEEEVQHPREEIVHDQGRVRRRAIFDDNLEDEIGDDDDEDDDGGEDDDGDFDEIKLRSSDNKVRFFLLLWEALVL